MDSFRSQSLLHLSLHHGEVKSILISGWISESCKFELQWGIFFVSPHLLQIMNQKWIGTYINKGDELISGFLNPNYHVIFPNWFTMWGVDHQHPPDLPLAYKKCENKTSQASQKPAKNNKITWICFQIFDNLKRE